MNDLTQTWPELAAVLSRPTAYPKREVAVRVVRKKHQRNNDSKQHKIKPRSTHA